MIDYIKYMVLPILGMLAFVGLLFGITGYRANYTCDNITQDRTLKSQYEHCQLTTSIERDGWDTFWHKIWMDNPYDDNHLGGGFKIEE